MNRERERGEEGLGIIERLRGSKIIGRKRKDKRRRRRRREEKERHIYLYPLYNTLHSIIIRIIKDYIIVLGRPPFCL